MRRLHGRIPPCIGHCHCRRLRPFILELQRRPKCHSKVCARIDFFVVVMDMLAAAASGARVVRVHICFLCACTVRVAACRSTSALAALVHLLLTFLPEPELFDRPHFLILAMPNHLTVPQSFHLPMGGR